MLKEMFEHVDDCRSSAWRHSLPGAPSVDPLDQLGLDPNVDICCFLFHAGEMGRPCRAPDLIMPAKRLIDATGTAVKSAKPPAADGRRPPTMEWLDMVSVRLES
jgi:hypothetical protein